MSKIKLPLRRYNLVLGFLMCFLSIFANEENFIGEYSQHEIKQRLENLESEVDLRLTSEVKEYLRDYLVSYRQSSEKLLGRSLLYFPEIEHKIQAKNLPAEIKFLSVIESSLKPEARSRVGAVGLWQFMKATAKMYGLKIDKNIDERKDVEKSTEAALEYLSDLNERFGDWTLALAAYNCGPGNVRKAMRRSGGHDYWSIRAYLPRETRNYVPKFIAMTYMMNYHADHDLNPDFPEKLFIKTRKAKVYETTYFTDLAKETGLSVEEIKEYNPQYVGNFVPKSNDGKILELPSEVMYNYLTAKGQFGNLIPDPFQDLTKETQVASQMIERREMIEIASLDLIDLKKIELVYENHKVVDEGAMQVTEPRFRVNAANIRRRSVSSSDRKRNKKERRQELTKKVRFSLLQE